MAVIDFVVTGELTIPTVIVEFSEEVPTESDEVNEQAEVIPMGGICRYLLPAVGKKDGINMEDVQEDDEEGIIYERDSDTYGEECNELEIASEDAMVKKEISIEEEMVVDYGRSMLYGYIRDYYRSPRGWHPPPVKEGSGEPQFSELDNTVGWIQSAHRPIYKSQNQGGYYISHSNGLLASSIPACIQSALDVLTGLFDRVGLHTNI